MTYNVFSGTLNPTHFTSLPLMFVRLQSELEADNCCILAVKNLHPKADWGAIQQ